MDFLLEKKIKINRDTKHKSLYSWCLNEFDDKESLVDRDWIPFRYGFKFIGKSLRVSTRLNVKRDFGTDKIKTRNSKTIHGEFYSGNCIDGKNIIDEVAFSIFGTARTIKKFSVTINEENNENEEACWFTAFPSYESEDAEFKKVIEDDFTGFDIYFNSEKFNELVKLVENRSIDFVRLSAMNIDGVYADWTPTIKTYSAKLLTSDNKIEGVDEIKFEGTTVSRVGEFEIKFTTQASLNIKQNLPSIDFSKKFDSDFENKNLNVIQNDVRHSEVNLQPLIQVVKSLKIALWFVFFALLFLLLRKR